MSTGRRRRPAGRRGCRAATKSPLPGRRAVSLSRSKDGGAKRQVPRRAGARTPRPNPCGGPSAEAGGTSWHVAQGRSSRAFCAPAASTIGASAKRSWLRCHPGARASRDSTAMTWSRSRACAAGRDAGEYDQPHRELRALLFAAGNATESLVQRDELGARHQRAIARRAGAATGAAPADPRPDEQAHGRLPARWQR
jgi:hypothetical protein